jgi:PWWP domain
VAALPESVTSRFGELCWAQGGSGYSWWPSMIFDPRRTEEPARTEGNRYLGTKYLVYFLECPENPFICLHNRQIKPWFDGFIEDFHTGKVAKSFGKQRLIQFQRALLVASHAVDLPPHQRMDLNALSVVRHVKKSRRRSSSSRKAESTTADNDGGGGGGDGGIVTRKRRRSSTTVNSDETMITKQENTRRPRSRAMIESQQDGYASDESKIMCKIVLKRIDANDKNIGMVFLSSVENATFSDVRHEIEKDLYGDLLPPDLDWRFYLPQACVPVSKRQETSMGSFYNILSKESDGKVGSGTFKSPVEIFIAEVSTNNSNHNEFQQ